MGPALQKAGVKFVFADNDGKLHQEQVHEAWGKFGISLWKAAGKTSWDRGIGGFPVDYAQLMPLDRSIHNHWKCRKPGGLYDLWNSRKPTRKTTGGFVNDCKQSWESISQEVFQNAIEGQRTVIRKVYANRGSL